MKARAILPRLSLALVLAAGIAWAYLNRGQLDPANLQLQLQSLGLWAPLAFIALFALATVLFLPGAIFGLAGGALFGPVWGSAWNLAGATLGATLAFVTARYVASDWVARRSGGRLKALIASTPLGPARGRGRVMPTICRGNGDPAIETALSRSEHRRQARAVARGPYRRTLASSLSL